MLARDGDDGNEAYTDDAADILLNLLDLALDLEAEHAADTSTDTPQPLSPGELAQLTLDLLLYAEQWDTRCMFMLNARVN